jgi:hypothetical protein
LHLVLGFDISALLHESLDHGRLLVVSRGVQRVYSCAKGNRRLKAAV